MSSSLNAFLFSTPEMMRAFAPETQARAMIRFEWALAQALEQNGLAPPGSATALEPLLNAGFVDFDALVRDAHSAGNIAIPLIKQLTSVVKERNEPASGAIHLGAT